MTCETDETESLMNGSSPVAALRQGTTWLKDSRPGGAMAFALVAESLTSLVSVGYSAHQSLHFW